MKEPCIGGPPPKKARKKEPKNLAMSLKMRTFAAVKPYKTIFFIIIFSINYGNKN